MSEYDFGLGDISHETLGMPYGDVTDNDFDTIRTKKKPSFKCKICHRCFKTKGQVKQHLQRHGTKLNQHFCFACKKQFLTVSHLKQHQCS